MNNSTTAIDTAKRLEAICREAYGADLSRVKALIKELASLPGDDYEYLRDAVFGQLCWAKQCLVCPVDGGTPGVYVVEYSSSMVKIGKTTDFASRLKSLSTMSPKPPIRTHFQPVAAHSFVEREMHRLYSGNRSHGEFFSVLFEDAVAELQEMAREAV
jgi:hypothetical protein